MDRKRSLADCLKKQNLLVAADHKTGIWGTQKIAEATQKAALSELNTTLRFEIFTSLLVNLVISVSVPRPAPAAADGAKRKAAPATKKAAMKKAAAKKKAAAAVVAGGGETDQLHGAAAGGRVGAAARNPKKPKKSYGIRAPRRWVTWCNKNWWR